MKLKRSTVLPLILLVYLAVMAWIGYENHVKYYWWILLACLVIIATLRWSLLKKERLRKQREDEQEDEQYGTYAESTEKQD